VSSTISESTVSQRVRTWREWSRLEVISQPWLWVAALTVVGLLLRRYHLGAESLWFDEADLVRRARQPVSSLLEAFTEAGENGPLYTLMLHYWLSAIDALPPLASILHRLFGPNDEALVRALSALFGAAAIPPMYWLAQRVAGVGAGVLATILLTVNPFHIWHSQDAKMYTLLVLMTLLTSVLYIDALERNSPRLWLGYVVATWIMLTVHSLSGLVLLAQLAATPFLENRNQKSEIRAIRNTNRWLRWAWAMLLIFIPLFPIAWLRLAALVTGTADVGGWYTPTGLGDILTTIFITFAVNRAGQPWEILGAAAMAGFALIGVVAFWRGRTTPDEQSKIQTPNSKIGSTWPLVLSLWLVPILVFWLITLRLPLFQPRYLIMALPPYLLIVAIGLLTLRRVHIIVGVVGAVLLALPTYVALAGVNYSDQVQKEDWRGALSHVQEHLRLRDVIVVFPGYMVTAVNYYYKPGGVGQVPQVDVKTIPSLRTEGYTPAQLEADLRAIVQCRERAWFITSPPRQQQEDPLGRVREWFQYNWHTFDTQVFNGVTVYGIAFNGQPECWYPEPVTSQRAEFENGLEFLGYTYELRNEETANNQPDASYFPLTMYWRNHEMLPTDYLVRIRIADPTGKVVVDEALGPLNGYWPTSAWPPNTTVIDYRDVRLPGGLAPGDYRVSVQVHPVDKPGEPLKLTDGGSEIVFKEVLPVVEWKPQ
jgi:4-amino-4-deoxy-L-arabinose transferase-like glycosyltransferase